MPEFVKLMEDNGFVVEAHRPPENCLVRERCGQCKSEFDVDLRTLPKGNYGTKQRPELYKFFTMKQSDKCPYPVMK